MGEFDRRWPLQRLVILSVLRLLLVLSLVAVTCGFGRRFTIGSAFDTIRGMWMWTLTGVELVTLIAQSVCFTRGNLNPKRCTFAHAGILLMYQVQFVIFSVGLGPRVLSARHRIGMSLHTAVAWSVSLMMIASACIAVQVYFALMSYQVWQRCTRRVSSVLAFKQADDDELPNARHSLPPTQRTNESARQPAYYTETTNGLPPHILNELSRLPGHTVVVITPRSAVAVGTLDGRVLSTSTMTSQPRSISVSSTLPG